MTLVETFWESAVMQQQLQDMTFKDIAKESGLSLSNVTTTFNTEPNLTIEKAFKIAKGVRSNLAIMLGAEDENYVVFPKTPEEARENFWENVDILSEGNRKQLLKDMEVRVVPSFVSGTQKGNLIWIERIATHFRIQPYRLIVKEKN